MARILYAGRPKLTNGLMHFVEENGHEWGNFGAAQPAIEEIRGDSTYDLAIIEAYLDRDATFGAAREFTEAWKRTYPRKPVIVLSVFTDKVDFGDQTLAIPLRPSRLAEVVERER